MKAAGLPLSVALLGIGGPPAAEPSAARAEAPDAPPHGSVSIAPVAVSPSLRLDSALAASAGLALLVKLAGACSHEGCDGLFAVADAEVGLFGQQLRIGANLSTVMPVLPYVLFDFFGLTASAAYLRRLRNFDGRLARPEEYLGGTVAVSVLLVSVRLGVYHGLDQGFLGSVGLGIGF